MALGEDYRAYEDAITTALRVLRPQDEVETVRRDLLLGSLDPPEPDLVMCDLPDTGWGNAWIELSTDPNMPTKVRLGTSTSEITNPDLEALLSLVEQADKLQDAGATR